MSPKQPTTETQSRDPNTPDQTGVPISCLAIGAQLFVFSVRQWRVAAHSKHCIISALDPFYARYGAGPALGVLDEVMSLLCATAFRPVTINCPCKSELNEDEAMLLVCLQHASRENRHAASRSIQDLIDGRLAISFCRVMTAYAAELRLAGLSVTGRRYLSAVPS